MSGLRDDVSMDHVSMTVDEFLAFTEDRPDDERWELIDGEPVLNPSPSDGHQKVARNLLSILMAAEDAGAGWELLPGLGVRLSERSMPVPDVLVRPAVRISGHYCDDMIAAFEILSPSSRKRDLQWKRDAYATLPSLQHYVVLHQDRMEALGFDRAMGWVQRTATGVGGKLDLATLGVALELRARYTGTGVTV